MLKGFQTTKEGRALERAAAYPLIGEGLMATGFFSAANSKAVFWSSVETRA